MPGCDIARLVVSNTFQIFTSLRLFYIRNWRRMMVRNSDHRFSHVSQIFNRFFTDFFRFFKKSIDLSENRSGQVTGRRYPEWQPGHRRTESQVGTQSREAVRRQHTLGEVYRNDRDRDEIPSVQLSTDPTRGPQAQEKQGREQRLQGSNRSVHSKRALPEKSNN